jgi:ribonuclease-3
VLRELGEAIERASEEPDDFDHKSRLQEKAVRDGEGTPRYVVVGSGPDHDRSYVAEVFLGGCLYGTGRGRSKKDAEQQAASAAWEELTGA